MKNPILYYGLIGAGIVVAVTTLPWFILKEDLSYTLAVSLGYLSILVALSSIYFAVRKYRDDIADGIISFGKAFKVGILTTLIPAGFTFISTAIFHLLQGAEFKAWNIENMKKSLSPEQYEAQMAQMESMGSLIDNPFFQGFVMFATILIIGVIISLIVAATLKRNNSN